MESQQVLANLPGQSFLSASSSKEKKCVFCLLFLVSGVGEWDALYVLIDIRALFVPQGAAGELGALALSR